MKDNITSFPQKTANKEDNAPFLYAPYFHSNASRASVKLFQQRAADSE